MVKSLVMLVANQTSVQGLVRKMGPDPSRWDWEYVASKIVSGSPGSAMERFDFRRMSMEPEFQDLMGLANYNLVELVSGPAEDGEAAGGTRGRRGATRDGGGGDVVEAVDRLGRVMRREQEATMDELRGLTKEQQLQMVRPMLDEIERSTVDYMNEPIVRGKIIRLDESARAEGLMHPDVAKEVKARVALHDLSRLMRRANGWIDKNPTGDLTVGNAVQMASSRGHTIEGEQVHFFLKGQYERVTTLQRRDVRVGGRTERAQWRQVEGLRSLEMSQGVAMAWDLLEKINSRDYQKILALMKADGRVGRDVEDLFSDREISGVTNFFQDSEFRRRDVVKKWVMQQMGGGHDIAEVRRRRPPVPPETIAVMEQRNKEVTKFIQLAENMAVVAMQPSRWNTGVNGGHLFSNESYGANDQLAEVIHFRNWRKSRAGRNRGGDISINQIPGWGDSWFGLNTKGKVVVECNGIDPENDDLGPAALYTDYIKDSPADYSGGDSLSAFASTKLTRYNALQGLFKDTEVKAGTITEAFLESANVYFTDAEKSFSDERFENLDLRFWWIAQVVDIGLVHDYLGWDRFSLDKLREVASERPIGGAGPFITPEQWNRLTSGFDPVIEGYSKKLLQLHFRKEMQGKRR